jgi:RND family efflux transporter MFP subunit
MIAVGLIAIIAGAVPLLTKKLGSDDGESLMTHAIARGFLSVTVTENGMLESSNNEEIKCYVKGGSTVLWVIETGTIVKPGDELVRLDDSVIEENITQQQITYERAVANKIIAQSNVDVAETNIEEYLHGTYLQERATIEKDIFDANERVKKSQLTLESAKRMAAKGLYRSLQLEGEMFAADSARKDLELKEKQLETLDLYRKKKTMQELQSNLDAAKARLAAEEASLRLEESRLNRDKEQLKNCIIKSEAEGMVIFPSAAEWKETPDIEEGARVREQQTLLMIPDVSKMQVKVGVHESKVSRLRVGMPAKVQLQDMTLVGEIDTIAEVTRPAGWWTGNMVKYDTIIKLAHTPGLKPGMSAVVDIVLAQHDNVLKIPVAAVIGNGDQFLCWVKTAGSVQKRVIELGDTNDEFTVVTAGLQEGDKVVLNPSAFIDEAQLEAMRPKKESKSEVDEAGLKVAAPAGEPDGSAEKKSGAPAADKKVAGGKKASAQGVGAKIIAAGDKNGDGVLTEDEFQEQDRANFPNVDADGDGKVNAAELEAAIKAASGE